MAADTCLCSIAAALLVAGAFTGSCRYENIAADASQDHRRGNGPTNAFAAPRLASWAHRFDLSKDMQQELMDRCSDTCIAHACKGVDHITLALRAWHAVKT